MSDLEEIQIFSSMIIFFFPWLLKFENRGLRCICNQSEYFRNALTFLMNYNRNQGTPPSQKNTKQRFICGLTVHLSYILLTVFLVDISRNSFHEESPH